MDEMNGIAHRMCGAKTYYGTPCKLAPVVGGTRCRLHGGGTPDSLRKAAETLAFLREPAIEVHHKVMHDFLTGVDCQTCGRSLSDPGPALRAAVVVLDRAGLHPTLSVQAVQSTDRPLQNFTGEQLADYAERLAYESRLGLHWSLEQIADHFEHRARQLREEARAQSISTDAEVSDEALVLAPRHGTFPNRKAPSNIQSDLNQQVTRTSSEMHPRNPVEKSIDESSEEALDGK